MFVVFFSRVCFTWSSSSNRSIAAHLFPFHRPFSNILYRGVQPTLSKRIPLITKADQVDAFLTDYTQKGKRVLRTLGAEVVRILVQHPFSDKIFIGDKLAIEARKKQSQTSLNESNETQIHQSNRTSKPIPGGGRWAGVMFNGSPLTSRRLGIALTHLCRSGQVKVAMPDKERDGPESTSVKFAVIDRREMRRQHHQRLLGWHSRVREAKIKRIEADKIKRPLHWENMEKKRNRLKEIQERRKAKSIAIKEYYAAKFSLPKSII